MHAVERKELLLSVISIAKQCGAIIKPMYTRGVNKEVSKDFRDILIEADSESNSFLVKSLLRFAFNIKSEENISKDSIYSNFLDNNSELTWIIDPIDGTVNFSKGIPYFSISIALVHNRFGPILGLVYNPISCDLYHSIGDNLSYKNGKKISVSNTLEIDRSAIVISDGASNDKMIERTLPYLNNLFYKARTVRVWGSAQLDLCSVASGVTDGYVKSFPPQWDCVAGAFIAKNAGAHLSNSAGTNINWVDNNNDIIVVYNGHIHSVLLQCMNESNRSSISRLWNSKKQ